MQTKTTTRPQVHPTPLALAPDPDALEALQRLRLTRRGLPAALAGAIVGLADLGPDVMDRRARR